MFNPIIGGGRYFIDLRVHIGRNPRLDNIAVATWRVGVRLTDMDPGRWGCYPKREGNITLTRFIKYPRGRLTSPFFTYGLE